MITLKQEQMKHAKLISFKQAILALLTIAVMGVCNSCKKASEKTTEKIIEKSMGNDAEVDIDDEKVVIKTDEGTFTSDATVKSWPKEIPDDVPEFKEGTVVSFTTQEMDEANNWIVIFEDVPQTALQEYKDILKSKGFNINYTTMAQSGGHLAAEKDKLVVVVMVGDGNASVSVGLKK